MKNQMNAINIIGVVISASLLILSQFSPIRDAASKALKLGTFQTHKSTRLTGFSISSDPGGDEKIQMSPVTSTTRIPSICLNQIEKYPQKKTVSKKQKQEHTPLHEITVPKTQKQEPECLQEITATEMQKQEPESTLLADIPLQQPSGSNGCPKNLDHFKKKPRPKQTPEECLTCKNLINCVCSTSG